MNVPFPDLPFQIRNYVLTSVLGSGGFSVVYKATNILYNIDFAVKVVCPKSQTSRGSSRSYDAEVRALLKLDHPNVIRLYDFFRDGDYMFLVLEFCSGGTLEDLIKHGNNFTEDQKIHICTEVISALKYCYDMSISHRDIKASNVLFDSSGRAKVSDFGLSELIGHDEEMYGEYSGSFYYSAPEIYRKVSFNPFKSDVWALGVLFFRLFTNEYPFYGKSRQDLKAQILTGNYKNYMTGPVSVIIRKMMIVEPDMRITINDLYEHNLFSSTTQSAKIIKNLSGVMASKVNVGTKLRRDTIVAKTVNVIPFYKKTLNPKGLDLKCINIKLGGMNLCKKTNVC